jgi:hypothetical protein
VNDERQRAALLSAGGGQRVEMTTRHDRALAGTPDHVAVGHLEADFSGRRIQRLRSLTGLHWAQAGSEAASTTSAPAMIVAKAPPAAFSNS